MRRLLLLAVIASASSWASLLPVERRGGGGARAAQGHQGRQPRRRLCAHRRELPGRAYPGGLHRLRGAAPGPQGQHRLDLHEPLGGERHRDPLGHPEPRRRGRRASSTSWSRRARSGGSPASRWAADEGGPGAAAADGGRLPCVEIVGLNKMPQGQGVIVRFDVRVTGFDLRPEGSVFRRRPGRRPGDLRTRRQANGRAVARGVCRPSTRRPPRRGTPRRRSRPP